MHIVIADDLTGAAEIAGVGLSRGLNGIISTKTNPESPVELWCLATDTRSSEREVAGKSMVSYTTVLKDLNPNIFYKKIDSVLRGNVMQECEAFAKAQGLDKVLMIPANPSLNRIVKDGTYFIDRIPLAEVNYFRNKKKSSRLLDLIDPAYKNQTKVIKTIPELNGPGYYIGEVETSADLLKWASLSDKAIALCGGSDFFDALLQFKGYERTGRQADIPFGERQLFVLGSATLGKNDPIIQITNHGFKVSNMPWEIFTNAEFSAKEIDRWVTEIRRLYQTSNKIILTMNYQDMPYKERPHLKLALGELICALMEQITIDELFVEGGATSFAILRKMGADQLLPVQNLARGVTRMEIVKYKSLKMTVKPGTYKWPETIWPRFKKMIS